LGFPDFVVVFVFAALEVHGDDVDPVVVSVADPQVEHPVVEVVVFKCDVVVVEVLQVLPAFAFKHHNRYLARIRPGLVGREQFILKHDVTLFDQRIQLQCALIHDHQVQFLDFHKLL